MPHPAIGIASAAGASQVFSLPVAASEPGILTVDGVYAAAMNEDGSINTSGHPATLGSVITLFVTGSGLWSGGLQTGQVSPVSLDYPVLPVKAYVLFPPAAGTLSEAGVLYAGSAPGLTDGVLQVNLRLPGPDALGLTGFGGLVTNLILQVGEVQSPPVTIWTRVRP